MEIDRRTFLGGVLGGAGAWALSSCTRSSPTAVRAADPSVPAARVTLRVPGVDYGFPSPFSYLPPGYSRVAYIFDTLLLADPNTNEPQPWLASNFEKSPDGRQYTFDLRDNVRWHDGQPLTASDVVFSFEYFRAKQQGLPPYIIFRPDHVSSVTALGDRKVRFNLDLPAVTFPGSVAATFPIVPRHIWASVADPGAQQDPKMLIGTGPYRLESYQRGKGAYLFVANDDFFLGKPFVKRLELRPVANELLALRAGEVDVGGPPGSGEPVSGRVLAPFRSNPAYGIVELPSDFTTALNWNVAKPGSPGADVRFRRACAMAIDRADLVKRILGGQGRPGNPGFLPPGHPYRVEVPDKYPFDPAAAGRLLDEAGYRRGPNGARRRPGGGEVRLRFVVLPVLAPVVEVVKAALSRIGVAVDLDPVDPFQLFIGAPDYDLAMLFYAGPGGDPDFMRTVFSSKISKLFFAARGYVNSELDDLADRQLVTFDETQRRAMVTRMQQIVASDLPVLHLYYPTGFFVYRRSVFDQFGGRYPLDKRILATGVHTGGTTIRPIAGG